MLKIDPKNTKIMVFQKGSLRAKAHLVFGVYIISLQCRSILGGRNLVHVCNIVVAAIFDYMTVEDWGE